MKTFINFVVALCMVFMFTVSAGAAPKRVPGAQPDNCRLCHGKEKALPADHVDIKKMSYGECKKCHTETLSLAGKFPASHIHDLNGVSCTKCHGKTKTPQAVKVKQCVTCHDPERLKEKTAKIKPENPHTSPHYGTGLDCNVCHHQHTKSENFCSQCHKFEFVVP
jgi:hypothetical protein